MKQLKIFITIVFFILNNNIIFAQITFQKVIGGTDYDIGKFVQQTFDGGYIVSGMTKSFGTGNGDIYLLRTNLLGDTMWTNTFDFSGVDDGRFVFQTSDNGFIVLRRDNTSISKTWLLKTDENGNSLWDKYYYFDPFSLNPTNDNGYIIAGSYHQNSIKHTAILKTDQNGDTLWMKTYPITDWCGADFAKQTSDNGYIISSWANDNGNLYTLIIKTDNNGNVIWTKLMSYGGKKIQQANDNGYALIFNDFNAQYFKLAKTDENGNIIWNKTYGGEDGEYANSFQQTSDNGYIIVGYTKSFGSGNKDIYLVKTDEYGDTLWTRTYGGIENDEGYSIQQTIDGGYVIAGITRSIGAGNGDVILIKTDEYGNLNSNINNWIAFYNNIPNNPDITDSKELWAGPTNSTPLPPVKICADGSNATLIKFKNNTAINNEYLKFVIESYNTSLNIDLSGEFKSEDYSYNEDTIIARYSHPTYLEVESLFREDKIQIIDISNNDNIIFEYPIQVYRAPVVMVHGLWGKSSTFANMETNLINSNRYNDPLLYRASYLITNSLSFSENANVIKNAINGTIYSTRFWNYSAGKVDIVAHSMGGVLSRLYLQNPICSQNQTQNCYREDIHKLITIGTPHSGTQSANLLMSNNVAGWLFRKAVNCTYLLNSGKKVEDGAVEDLQVDSDAILNDLNGSSLSNNPVPSHVVISESDFSNAFSWPLLLYIPAQAVGMSIDEFLLYLYYDVPNDLIVPINSEDGGLSTSYVSHFYSQIHLGQASNNDIIDEIKIALKLDPGNTDYFSHSGFSPDTLTSHFKADPIGVLPLELANGSIDIISPNYGDFFNAGDIIQVSVSGSSNISKIIFTAFSSSFNNDVFISDTTQLSSVIFNYQIPIDSYGMTNIMVFGFDNDGFVDYDTLSINIYTTANLDSIISDPKRMFIATGQKRSISLTGYFDDGIQRNLSYIDEVQYTIMDTVIAKHVNLNVIEGKNAGNTILTINYQNQSIEIPIEVFEAENWVIGIMENPQWGKSYGQSIIKNLKVYPNPSNDIATIDYELLENAFVKLEVFNLFGNRVSIKINEKQLKAKHSYQIDLRDFKTGVYFYTLTANNSIQSGKLIIMK